MLKFQPLITTGAGLLFVLPSVVLQDADISSLSGALKQTEHALEVLRGVESKGVPTDASAGSLLRGLTEAPIADGPTRDAELDRLRNEVALLQVELDALDAQAYSPGAGLAPMDATGNLAGDPAGLPAMPPPMSLTAPPDTAGVTTGLSAAQRAALLQGGELPKEPMPGTTKLPAQDGAATTGDAAANAGGASTAARHGAPSAGDPGYSADPVMHAQALLRAGRYREGQALVQGLTDPIAVYLQARFLEKLGRLDEAVVALESVIDQLPAGYEQQRAQSDLEFFKWKQEFLARLPEDVAKPKDGEGQ